MGYIGESIPVPLGQKGIISDLPQSLTPYDALSQAINIEMNIAGIFKAYGSSKFNSDDQLDGEVVSLYDWWPDSDNQRTIAATTAGKVYRDTGDGSFASATEIASSLGSLDPTMQIVAGGSEDTGENKKLFLFHNNMVPKFIDGDAATLSSFTNLATDWSSANPTFGINHLSRMWVFGNSNQPHRVYVSLPTDHADFTSAGFLTFEVYPGEGDRLTSGIVYKGVMYLFKEPEGVYYLDAPSTDTDTWGFKKLDGGFGIGSPHGVIQVLDDLLIFNAENSITSVQATAAFGDLKFGDIVANAQLEKAFKETFDRTSKTLSQAVYYSDKKTAMFTMKSNGSSNYDRILNIDVKNVQNPRFHVNNKDAPNCIALRRDDNKIRRPIYGDTNGYVWLMDQESTYTVDGASYSGDFTTPELDFGFFDRRLANMNKHFDFITLIYEGLSNDSVFVDVTIDGRFIETLEVDQFTGTGLDDFELDTDVLDAIQLEEARIPLHGSGRRIQLRIYNSTANGFRIEQLLVDLRVGDEGKLPTSADS